MNDRGVNAYRQTDVLTADPKRLVLMCYEGAIHNLKIALEKERTREYEARAKAVQKAGDIIDELAHALDFEQGGEIASNLDRLYNYMTRRILYAEANRQAEPLKEVAGLLEELKGAWEEVFVGKGSGAGESSSMHVTEQHGNDVSYERDGVSARL